MEFLIFVAVVAFLGTLAVLTVDEQHKEILKLKTQLSKADFDLAINKAKNKE
ncbi:hypothetical protein [Weissella paramesenteroides]|uniref:hypothetical protein n=1 Tax=Weissella paramesenteroides TaxID=1249 RepID=UPI0039826652